MENRFLEHVLPGRHEGAGERVRFSVDCLFGCGNDSSCQRPATPSSSWRPVKPLVDSMSSMAWPNSMLLPGYVNGGGRAYGYDSLACLSGLTNPSDPTDWRVVAVLDGDRVHQGCRRGDTWRLHGLLVQHAAGWREHRFRRFARVVREFGYVGSFNGWDGFGFAVAGRRLPGMQVHHFETMAFSGYLGCGITIKRLWPDRRTRSSFWSLKTPAAWPSRASSIRGTAVASTVCWPAR